MSQAASAPSLWIQHGSPRSARERLSKAVTALIRARRLQVLVDHAFGGLLVGLALATLAVLVARLLPAPVPSWQLAGTAVSVAIAVGLLVGWWRRPDALEVAIRADLTLKLKQRLSTAWEFMTIHGDDELAERLAVQAVKVGLPVRPEMVFPLQVNRWGRLAPLAATALLLVSVLDLDWIHAPAAHEVDEQVVSEGQRLGAFGRAMQTRARRDELPRSANQAAQLERLGSRMEGGALSRGEALMELQRMGEALEADRMQVLAEANRTNIGPLHAGREKSLPAAPRLDPAALLARTRRGALDSNDIQALVENLNDRERSGISRRELEEALKRHQAGDNEGLEKMLEKLAQIDRARKEDKELGSAREQVLSARANLGESLSGENARRNPIPDLDAMDDLDEGSGRSDLAANKAGRRARGPENKGTRAGSRGDSSIALERQDSPLSPDSGTSGAVLTPPSQAGKGEVFMSQARVPPRPGRPSVENLPMSSEFVPQVEEVLAKDQYPTHYKEFVRRYFLNLSQGQAQAPQDQPPAKKGTP
jgi:hypothetical protein